jgi:hypothetical protein
VVDDDEGSRNVLATSIRRRYGNDYEVVGASGPEAGRAARERLHSPAADVAMIAARQSMASEDGTTCPSAARPGTSRRHRRSADAERRIRNGLGGRPPVNA